MSPAAEQSSAAEQERDLAKRPESDTTIPQYYKKSGNNKNDDRQSDDLESRIDHDSYGTQSKSSSKYHSGHRPRPATTNASYIDDDHVVVASESTPLLDPSDPAVSPLNLRSIKFLFGTLWVLLFTCLILTLILFINTFVTLPLLNFRDSGFQELVLLVVADLSLFLSICFFRFPLDSNKVLGFVSAGSLFLALVLSLSFPNTRHRVTLASFFIMVWTLFCVILGLIVTPAAVKKANIHEEIRLTGRVERRKTVGQLAAVPFVVLVVLILAVVPCVFMCMSVMLDMYDYIRLHQDLDTGSFVDIYPKTGYSHGSGHGDSGYKIPTDKDRNLGFSYSVYVYCTPFQGGKGLNDVPPSIRPSPDGSPAPIVLVEADSGSSAQMLYKGWLDEMYNNQEIAQVCYWNRPGRGFSDNAPSPFSAGMAADAFTIALRSALNAYTDSYDNTNSEDNEYDILKDKNPFGNRTFAVVGHGTGGLYSRVFAARHIQNMHSLTLVDAYPEELLVRRLGKPSRGFRDWWAGVWTVFGFERQLSWLVRGRGPSVRVFGKMAATTRPNELKANLQEQISALGLLRNDIETANSILHGSDIPLAVLSSAQMVKQDSEWAEYQKLLTKVTAKNVVYEVVEGPHDLWLTEKAKKKMQKVLYNLLCQRDNTK